VHEVYAAPDVVCAQLLTQLSTLSQAELPAQASASLQQDTFTQ
jgi:hypothetical protein